MSRNRFKDILRNLHVRDNLTITAGQKDGLFKLRPMIDLLSFRFKYFNQHSRHCGSIGVYKWRDSKTVRFASNYHGTEVASVKRTNYDGSTLVITAPQVAKDYNDHMGGLDLLDLKRAAYG
ncbi:hypothetical protein QYM36_019216 [Artemia franciscana]|uniref:PiggyBac transposable element-derived protein domain-containing protein n=1 Tax=Artemia franciscana TaxID=6661 RepID=A0AA88H1H7_ARTSF|nr:hypothetical protein QYM36_019216 [Artemia franciscana]